MLLIKKKICSSSLNLFKYAIVLEMWSRKQLMNSAEHAYSQYFRTLICSSINFMGKKKI